MMTHVCQAKNLIPYPLEILPTTKYKTGPCKLSAEVPTSWYISYEFLREISKRFLALNMFLDLLIQVLLKILRSADNNMNCSAVCNAIGCRTRAKYRCSDCQKVWYCSQMCQEKDWKLHHKDLCPIYKISDDEGPAGLLMLIEMLFGKVPWHCVFNDEARLRRFAKGSLDMGISIEDSDGRPLTMDIYDYELSPEERQAAMLGLVMSRMTDLLPDSSLIEKMLGKIPINCHQCGYRGANQNLRPDANLAGTRFLCLPCDSKNEVLYDFNCLNWNQVGPEDPDKFPEWVNDVLFS
ncbi:hypothetical protein FisN_21Lu182 [Fistulifera solaris]|uniref:MYND-type domain-containing protein n=1 Tax=Fistulifera solaris TaxID=1519565 RepID=A0A1Z5J9H2_FISSO|nr:hypothetical protein FisN_21Lu182 [Fistulifera solaris]|eukprot:GAX10458.1 hypothetical protein FisN_21Lu182 [Fistulifera solaris]